MKCESETCGFSLVELAIALGIVGLVTATFLQEYRQYKNNQIVFNLGAQQSAVINALEKYITREGHYPCPADPGLSDRDDKAGMGYWVSGKCADSIGIGSTGGFASGGKISRVAASIDPNGGAKKSSIIIGSLPYVDLGLTPSETYDGWGNKFAYAVTDVFTTTIKGNYGTIDLRKKLVLENGEAIQKMKKHSWGDDATAVKKYYIQGQADPVEWTPVEMYSSGDEVTDSADNSVWACTQPQCLGNTAPTFAMGRALAPSAWQRIYQESLVWSFGSSRRGGYTPDGRQPFPCQDLTKGADNENCDNDDVFLGGYDEDGGASLRKLLAGPDFYDTRIFRHISSGGNDRWSVQSNPDGVPNELFNADIAGRVGVNTPAPEMALDVRGNIRTPRISADRFCDDSGSNCFSSQLIGGSGTTTCGEADKPQSIAGFAKGRAACPGNVAVGSIKDGQCADGQYVYQITATGKIKCKDLP